MTAYLELVKWHLKDSESTRRKILLSDKTDTEIVTENSEHCLPNIIHNQHPIGHCSSADKYLPCG